MHSCLHIEVADAEKHPVAVGAPKTVIGHRGERVDIGCSYDSGYEANPKYFCKGDCLFPNKIIIKSGSPAKDERFSLTDNTTARVFTVTITDLRTEDEGRYWCAATILPLPLPLPLFDVYSEILLLVKQEQVSHAGSVIYICVGLVIMVIIFLIALLVFCKQRKSKKPPRVTQSGLSQQVSVRLLPLNTRGHITAEDVDRNDHIYQEVSEFQCNNKHTNTIYTTAESPDDPPIYYTADNPDDPVIYYTADNPDDPAIYFTADNPDDPAIYFTADKLDDLIISSTSKSK
ncbi:uncharacterized protein [Pseudorasbora parva]|uniref:uncharacterized protein n=1 Tax=Pseudorasbora parva TaxID=51549 RepID=UPI00351E6B90